MNYIKASSLTFRKLVSLIFLWLCFHSPAAAQSIYEQVGRLPVTTYTPEEYGGNPNIDAIIQGANGLMYVGTYYGINEYDGVSWRSIFGRTIVKGISAFAKDATGRIFYAGEDFGYLATDPKGVTQAVSLLNLIPEDLRGNLYINSIFFLDKFILLQAGSFIIRLELNKNLTLKSLKSWPAETTFSRAFLVGKEYYVRQSERGLFRLEGNELKIVPGTEIYRKEPLTTMLPFPDDGDGTLLLLGTQTGTYLFNGKALSKFPTAIDNLIKEGYVPYTAIPFQGNYIIGFLGRGIVVMNPKGEILKKLGTSQGLPSDVVLSLYLDQSGGLWAGTEYGLSRIAINSPIISFGKESGINSQVSSIRKVSNEFFLGTTSGLVQFNAKEKLFKLRTEPTTGSVTNLIQDGADLIICGQQLMVLRGKKAITLKGPKDGSRPISALIPKSNRNLLFVGTNYGLLVYQRGLSKELLWEYKGEVPQIKNGMVRYLFEGKDSTVFVFTSENVITLNNKEIELYSGDPSRFKPTFFKYNSSEVLMALLDGELFVGYKDEMQKYSAEEEKFVTTEDFSQLKGDLFDINQGKTGIKWYEAVDGKKYILKRDTGDKFIRDDKPTAIAPYLSFADFMDEDSIMWFGSEKGLIRYDPKKDNQTEKKFFTLIRRIESKKDTLPLIGFGRDKTLPAIKMKDNSLRFEFAAPYFEEESKTKYQTYLEGFDNDWIDWNANRFKEYTNLSPGTYKFRVRAMAYTGRMSEEAVYSFVVLPPWYATWWAYMIFALLILGIIAAVVKWRSQKLKAENLLLEERVNERTAALEKSLADLKSTQTQLIQSEKMASLGELTAGIAHEIQNPLNFVNNFSEINKEMIAEMKEEIDKGNYAEVKLLAKDISDNEEKINYHGKRADAIVKGMLQHSRNSSGQKELTDINGLCDEYLRLSYHGLRAKDKSFNATFETDFDKSIEKINIVPQEIGRVILNLINNAFYAVNEKAKQNIAGYEPTVTVNTKKQNEQVVISVNDNGNGIPESIKEKIFQPFFTTKPTGSGTGLGLSLSYDIIKAHGGEINVESKEGEGTAFMIQLPV